MGVMVNLPLSLHLGIEYGKGGEGRIVSELRRWLPEAGIHFSGLVATPDDAASMTSEQVKNFAPEGASLPARLLGVRRATRSALRTSQVAVIASHFALYTLPVLDLLDKVPLVSHFHGPWALESLQEGEGQAAARIKMRAEGAVYRRAQRVIVLSRAFADLAQERFGVSPEIIRLVPGAVDVDRFAPQMSRAEARTRLDLPADRPVLLSIRRLVQRMGLGNLLEAMQAVVAEFPEVLLCIGGQGPLRATLEQKTIDLQLGNNVRFLGFVSEEDLPVLYRAADINVVPTLALEGFGLVAAEALAAGTPSMVTAVGGLPEVVRGLSPELVFASTSAPDIAAGLVAALAGKLSLPTATACREFALQHYTAQRMARQVADVYREVIH